MTVKGQGNPNGFHLRRDAVGRWWDVSATDPYVMPPCTFDFDSADGVIGTDDKALAGCVAHGADDPPRHRRRFGGFPQLGAKP